ncbi:cutinase family protein [Nocardia carnea]|uniref:cutinase family protein n=1 Tax=Nocardia carnea TaxID=37328 RepID=UPI002457BA43|nr:cutinase family protein [Nocardia carnea]
MTSMIRGTAAATLAAATAAAVIAVPGTAVAAPADTGNCPALIALGVQGTGESSPNADSTSDTGMLGEMFRPFQAGADAAGVPVHREYVPYDAGFGGFVPGGTSSYQTSVSGGTDRLSQTIADKAQQCPGARFALAGYSQGSHVVSLMAQEIGQGSGPVPADRVAAVALFADPTRTSGAAPFPGSDQQLGPEPAPGTSGQAITAIADLAPSGASGGGIGPERDRPADFGALTGRVASFCSPGDLACDAPDKAPLLRAVANVAGQAEFGGDPLRALASITQALAFTGIKTFTNVVNQDISGNSLANLSLNPKKSISARIAEASDPRTPVDPGKAIAALFKVGSIALNSAVTVARTLLTPANIAEIAAAGLANPVAGLAIFGTKLLGALPQIIPPSTGTRLVQQTFKAVVDNVTDNTDMLDLNTWVKYSEVITRHASYANYPVTADGRSATQFVADWFVSAARDSAESPVPVTEDTPGSSTGPDSPATPTTAPTSSPSTPAPWTFELQPSTAPAAP